MPLKLRTAPSNLQLLLVRAFASSSLLFNFCHHFRFLIASVSLSSTARHFKLAPLTFIIISSIVFIAFVVVFGYDIMSAQAFSHLCGYALMPAITMLSVPSLSALLCHLPRHFLCSQLYCCCCCCRTAAHPSPTHSLHHRTLHSFTNSFTFNSVRSLCFMVFTVVYMFCCCLCVFFIIMRSCFLFTFDFSVCCLCMVYCFIHEGNSRTNSLASDLRCSYNCKFVNMIFCCFFNILTCLCIGS